MAVQQNKKSPSKRGMHRSHDFLVNPPLAVEPTTGETHLRHHAQSLDLQTLDVQTPRYAWRGGLIKTLKRFNNFKKLIVFCSQNFTTTIITAWANVMT